MQIIRALFWYIFGISSIIGKIQFEVEKRQETVLKGKGRKEKKGQ